MPLPSAISGFKAAIAVKSLVNEDVEITGAVLVEVLVELDVLVLELDDELPHPAMIATVSSAVTTAPIRLKRILHSLSGRRHGRLPGLSLLSL